MTADGPSLSSASLPSTSSVGVDEKYEEWMKDLNTFLDLSPRFRDEVVISREEGGSRNGEERVKASILLRLDHAPLQNTSIQVEAMNYLRTLSSSSPLRAFPYSPYYVFFEQYPLMTEVAVQSIVSALICLFFVSIIFFRSFLAAALAALLIIIVDCNVFGMLYILNIGLHSVSAPLLVLAVGLAVDYAAHVGHAVIHTYKEWLKCMEDAEEGGVDSVSKAEGKEEEGKDVEVSATVHTAASTLDRSDSLDVAERPHAHTSPARSRTPPQQLKHMLQLSLHGVAPAVLHAAISSLIGIFPCFFSTSAPLQIFARVFVSIVVFSFIHGVFTFPFLLSFLLLLKRVTAKEKQVQ
uniref:SSD domain-containing protein n=2 Tax=Palpitomonas bilix TaxID=652834 RepID=A0A7S3DH56_9EUKA|mmetsp:Transcript_37110/g.96249  ORF Transcript_37110/g.96249 Transcript_37110/m.96249 type:complete len:352 (+) Transcript_37110:193-1248(+)